jgi:hypothetical protein
MNTLFYLFEGVAFVVKNESKIVRAHFVKNGNFNIELDFEEAFFIFKSDFLKLQFTSLLPFS